MTTTKTDEVKLVKVELDNDHQINGVHYHTGTNEVSAEIAVDLERADKAHNKYLAGLNKNTSVSGSLGSVSAA